jgi:hypothetical protein
MVVGLKKANNRGLWVDSTVRQLFNFRFGKRFDVVEVAHFSVADECDGCAVASHASGSADAVEVHLGFCWHVVVDYVCDALDV